MDLPLAGSCNQTSWSSLPRVMNSDSKIINTIRLFRAAPHPCSYKDSEQAATVFVDPEIAIDKGLNSKLSELGYRRSGPHLYRPDCDHCTACISCRIPVADFRLKRRYQKIWNANRDLRVIETANLDTPAGYALYKQYINTRHRDGDMYPASPEQYTAFIQSATTDTRFLQFYQEQQLLAVAVVDMLDQGLSAVYTFFDPTASKRSLGNFAILWQVHLARERQLPYLYLGYWIKGCAKMQYKSSFRPIEMLLNGKWARLL